LGATWLRAIVAAAGPGVPGAVDAQLRATGGVRGAGGLRYNAGVNTLGGLGMLAALDAVAAR